MTYSKTPRHLQFRRGIKFANVPGGKAENVDGDVRVWHVNTVMNAIQNPDNHESGVINVYPEMSGSSLQQFITSSADVKKHLNFQRSGSRVLYDRLLQGTAYRSETGEDRTPDVAGNFYYPVGICVDDGAINTAYVTDGNAIRKVILYDVSSSISTFIGSISESGNVDGTGSDARLIAPYNICIDASQQNLYTTSGHSICKITLPDGAVSTIAGNATTSGDTDDTGSLARFTDPTDLCIDAAGDIFVVDNGNNTIRKIAIADYAVSTIAGESGVTGDSDGTGSSAHFLAPVGIAYDSANDRFYISDYGNHTIRRMTQAGEVSTFAGLAGNYGTTDDTGSLARFYNPWGLAVDSGENVFVSDYGNYTIRMIVPDGVVGAVSTFAGLGGDPGYVNGIGSIARFNRPYSIFCRNDTFYVADGSTNNVIRKVTSSKLVSTVAGVNGTPGVDEVTDSITYNERATPPSWTHRDIGLAQSYVIGELSSSNHEVTSLNAHLSGVFPLEASPVPASGALYYSKTNKLLHKIYKVTASADLSILPAPVTGPFDQEIFGRSNYEAVSGCYINNTVGDPAIIEINVPDHGRIRDIKVWVEFIHDVRLGTGTIGTSDYGYTGLGTIGMALRSPNTHFNLSYPFSKKIEGIDNELWHNSYVLWEGALLKDNVIGQSHEFSTWQYDIDMRTIFCDNATVLNPRHIDELYPNAKINYLGTNQDDWRVLSGNSPNFVAHSYDDSNDVVYFDEPSSSGKFVSWFDDRRITGSLKWKLTSYIGQSPPNGWLTGEATTADVNEFDTTGSNVGPEKIRPLLPLLDGITNKRMGSKFAEVNVGDGGHRPGLRGTEVNGTWKLMIGTIHNDVTTPERNGIWFRQCRLEFVIDEHKDINRHLFFNRVSLDSYNNNRYCIMSGALPGNYGNDDLGVDYIIMENPCNFYCRTFGITDNPESDPKSFAVFTRVTGSLMSSSVTATFLNNEFGTPYIPISSGSSVQPSFEPFTDDDVAASHELMGSILSRKPLLNQANTLKTHIARADVTKSTRDQVEQYLSALYSSSI